MESKKPPIYLNLREISLPVTGVVSILHRVTGIIMIFSLPLWLALFAGFVWPSCGKWLFEMVADQFLLQLALFLASSAWWYHIIAGFRHLFHDFSGNHSLRAMRQSAVLVLLFSALIFIAIGWGVWR